MLTPTPIAGIPDYQPPPLPKPTPVPGQPGLPPVAPPTPIPGMLPLAGGPPPAPTTGSATPGSPTLPTPLSSGAPQRVNGQWQTSAVSGGPADAKGGVAPIPQAPIIATGNQPGQGFGTPAEQIGPPDAPKPPPPVPTPVLPVQGITGAPRPTPLPQTPIPLSTGIAPPTTATGDPSLNTPGIPATPYANITPNQPGTASDYTDKTITPGAGVDRLALAKSNFEDYSKSSDPEFQAALREANQAGAVGGQLGSGQLRTRIGDLGLARTRDLASQQTKFLNDATQGSIADNYANIGIAQQQQGFQQGQQQTAFDQQQRTQALNEALKNGDFQRYYQLLQAGQAGSPADTQLALAGNYGAQAGAAGASAGNLAGSAVRQNVTPYQLPLAA